MVSTASIAITRYLALNQTSETGTMIFNPGGPGGSGTGSTSRIGKSLYSQIFSSVHGLRSPELWISLGSRSRVSRCFFSSLQCCAATLLIDDTGPILDVILQGKYNVLGFDPRGINQTLPFVSCLSSLVTRFSLEEMLSATAPSRNPHDVGLWDAAAQLIAER